jgi:co-chaperonin GroES (HSP10)
MKVSTNFVRITPDKDIEEAKGYSVTMVGSEHRYLNIRGKVVDIPDKLLCNGRAVRSLLGGLRTTLKEYAARAYSNSSLMHDTVIDIKEGDIVYFPYSYKLELDQYNTVEGDLILSYDAFFARERDGKMSGLNGNVIIEMLEREVEEEVLDGMFIEHDDRNKYGWGKVVGTGKQSPVGITRDHRDMLTVKEGMIVHFPKSAAFRIEIDEANSMTTNQSSFFVVRNERITAWI